MPDRASDPERLSRNRDFKVLLTTQGISSLGDAVSFTALPLLVLALTGSGLAMGVVGALQTLPDLVFGMVAGALADRSDRKRMMFLADLGRAALTAVIPLSVYLGGPTMAVILIVAAPMSVLRSFFLAGYTASVPALVGRSADGPRELVLRGRLLARLHRRPGHRRTPGGDHRAGRHAGHRCRIVRAVGRRPDLRAPRSARPGGPATPAAADGDPRGDRLHRTRAGAARRDPVLGRDVDHHRAARDRARRPHHAGPRGSSDTSSASCWRPTGSAPSPGPWSSRAAVVAGRSRRCSSAGTSSWRCRCCWSRSSPRPRPWSLIAVLAADRAVAGARDLHHGARPPTARTSSWGASAAPRARSRWASSRWGSSWAGRSST